MRGLILIPGQRYCEIARLLPEVKREESRRAREAADVLVWGSLPRIAHWVGARLCSDRQPTSPLRSPNRKRDFLPASLIKIGMSLPIWIPVTRQKPKSV